MFYVDKQWIHWNIILDLVSRWASVWNFYVLMKYNSFLIWSSLFCLLGSIYVPRKMGFVLSTTLFIVGCEAMISPSFVCFLDLVMLDMYQYKVSPHYHLRECKVFFIWFGIFGCIKDMFFWRFFILFWTFLKLSLCLIQDFIFVVLQWVVLEKCVHVNGIFSLEWDMLVV